MSVAVWRLRVWRSLDFSLAEDFFLFFSVVVAAAAPAISHCGVVVSISQFSPRILL